MAVSQIRVARPTDKFNEVVRFYCDGLGLTVIGSFENHDGYDGIMLALPGRRDHLEFTSHRDGSPCAAPSQDNLLVFYLPEPAEFAALEQRLKAIGQAPVQAENAYWTKNGALTFEDPDGWRVVLFPGSGL